MTLTKYYLEYELTGNTKLWAEDTIYIDKSTQSVAIGKVTGTTYKFLVTGSTYTETLFLGGTPTGTGSDVLIIEGNQVKKKTGGAGVTPVTQNYNVQYYYDGILSGSSTQIDYFNQQVLRVNRALYLTGSTSVMTSPSPIEGDIIRLKGNSRYTDGYYIYDAGGSWVSLSTW